MTNGRLTLEEMEEKYPDQWLFIVDCEFIDDTELVSGVVTVHSTSRADVYAASGRYKGETAIHYTGKEDPKGRGYWLPFFPVVKK